MPVKTVTFDGAKKNLRAWKISLSVCSLVVIPHYCKEIWAVWSQDKLRFTSVIYQGEFVISHCATLLCSAELKKKAFLCQTLSRLNHFYMHSLFHLFYGNTFNSFPLSSLELICFFIYLFIKRPNHFRPRGIDSFHPVSLGDHAIPTNSTKTGLPIHPFRWKSFLYKYHTLLSSPLFGFDKQICENHTAGKVQGLNWAGNSVLSLFSILNHRL